MPKNISTMSFAVSYTSCHNYHQKINSQFNVCIFFTYNATYVLEEKGVVDGEEIWDNPALSTVLWPPDSTFTVPSMFLLSKWLSKRACMNRSSLLRVVCCWTEASEWSFRKVLPVPPIPSPSLTTAESTRWSLCGPWKCSPKWSIKLDLRPVELSTFC